MIEIKYQQGSSNESWQEASRQELIVVGGRAGSEADLTWPHCLPLSPAASKGLQGQPGKQASHPGGSPGHVTQQDDTRPDTVMARHPTLITTSCPCPSGPPQASASQTTRQPALLCDSHRPTASGISQIGHLKAAWSQTNHTRCVW